MTENPQLDLIFEPRAISLLTADEIYAGLNESTLRALVEDERIEVKGNGVHCKELGTYFSMWANTPATGGLIVVGIRKDVQFEGCSSLPGERLNKLQATGDDHCPDAAYSVKRVKIHRDSDGQQDFVLAFRVRYNTNRVVKTTDAKAFVRRADRIKQLRTPEEISQLQEEKGEVCFETEPCRLEYPAAFEMGQVSEFVEAVRERKGWEEHHTTEAMLVLLHLGRMEEGKFQPNVACALLFAKDPRLVVPGARIHFLRFEGESAGTGADWNAVKDEFIDGTIPEQIVQAESMLRSQLRTFSRIEKPGQFTTSPEYPALAWYEAIVNACVHRSYGDGMKHKPIFIKMYDDRLEIESPGAFPPFVTAETIYDNHHPRNPFLGDALYYLKFVKMAAEGARRMRDEMAKMALPSPEFQQREISHVAVNVTLRNKIKQRKVWVDSDVATILGQQIAASLTVEQNRCINYVAEYGKINVSQAMRLMGRDWMTMKKVLDGLVVQRILEWDARKDITRDPKAHYRLARNLRPK